MYPFNKFMLGISKNEYNMIHTYSPDAFNMIHTY